MGGAGTSKAVGMHVLGFPIEINYFCCLQSVIACFMHMAKFGALLDFGHVDWIGSAHTRALGLISSIALPFLARVLSLTLVWGQPRDTHHSLQLLLPAWRCC